MWDKTRNLFENAQFVVEKQAGDAWCVVWTSTTKLQKGRRRVGIIEIAYY